MVSAETIHVVVAWSPVPREVQTWALELPVGSVIDDALRAAGLLYLLEGEAGAQLQVGIWAKARPRDTVLRERDRVELWRPLKVDPKEARRQRYRKAPR